MPLNTAIRSPPVAVVAFAKLATHTHTHTLTRYFRKTEAHAAGAATRRWLERIE
jgi:hypothetical protein